MILICTDNGEMLLCANNGEYKAYILDSPLGKCIDSVFSFSNGFIICAENNFMVFQSEDGDERTLLSLEGDAIPITMRDSSSNQSFSSCTIRALTLNEDEDHIYAVTSNGQLVTAQLELTGNGYGANELTKFDYVLGPFHRAEITGLDVCVRK